MNNKNKLVYISLILLFAVFLCVFFSNSYNFFYSDALCYFFSPFKDKQTDYYITVIFDVIATGMVFLFAKFVLRKLHNQGLSEKSVGICKDLVITHLAVCLFTLLTFWIKIEWQYYAAFQFIFSILFYVCLLIYHRKKHFKSVVVKEKQIFNKARLLLSGVLVILPIVVAVIQIYLLIFSFKDYEYISASPVSMYFLPIKIFLQPIVRCIFNPEFFNVLQWQTLCTDILPYCLLAVLVDCATGNLALIKNVKNVNQTK